MVRRRPGRGLFYALRACLLAASITGCEPAKTPLEPGGGGPDTTGPLLALSPAADTTVDATGSLLVNVVAHDQSTITSLTLIVPGVEMFVPVSPNDTAVIVGYPIPLTGLSGSQFTYYAQATDILNHETVTSAVTVTVR